jgi:adenylate kinase
MKELTTETFYGLVFNGQSKRAYLSFPMTAVEGMENVKNEIDEFRHTMKQSFICFDPGDLEESYLPLKAQRASEKGLDYVEVTTLGRTVRLDLHEVRQIERDINSQIYARDFMLIDQAEMIISLIPAMDDGRASISSGVERELQHAHEAAKEVYVIWTAKQTPSVFITQTATQVFNNIAGAIDFFKKKGYIKRS